MRPRERRETGKQDLFRSRLDQIIDLNHPLVKLAKAIDWSFLERHFGEVYKDGPGHPPLPTRLMAGLAILKHSYDLSDEVLCERWVENPYYQYFCGEEFFQHRLVFDRSSMTHWRQRMGEERLKVLLQESLSVAAKTGALKPSELSRVIVDTTVQPKNVTFPTDAKLLNRAREKLVRLARQHGVSLRQSYARLGKIALIQHQRYAHAKQFKRARRVYRKLRTYLGRVMRDLDRKIEGNEALRTKCARLLSLARRVHEQQQRQRGPKVYSLHAPEVECIGKGKPHRPYEFGVKVSVATTLAHAKGGQFVAHVQALPGNPYDGHTLATVIPDMQAMLGNTLERIYADKGYRGHNAPPDHRFRVFIAGQKRRMTPAIKRQLRRRSAIEPVIGHLKAEHRMGRNYLWHRHGDAANAILAAAGYNFRRLIRWLSLLLCLMLAAFSTQLRLVST
ncbi:IS5 family transposase [Mesorhizobium sp. BAC0120]|uniref:IS5 family transposase n=1 Tax=Mesorhizobium sp. BAC0120 TaxID=3090670 RepID=UPI00298CDE75|nr:IS5 family transposase [Mesorhizobium sp. BAC0120]MDW6026675.1 IS5 family transposase [Mesorhizobium sp. BAC0120]